jgi:hypothetical protein
MKNIILFGILGFSAYSLANKKPTAAPKAAHPCSKAVLEKAKTTLEKSDYKISDIVIVSADNDPEVSHFVIKATASSDAEKSKFTEQFKLSADGSCEILGTIELIEDSRRLLK